MMNNRIKLILFDCDGTLVDSVGKIERVMRRVFTEFHLDPPPQDAVRSVIGLSLPQAIASLLPQGHEGALTSMVERYRLLYLQDEVAPLFPGTMSTLADLQRKGYLLGVVTGSSTRGWCRVMERFGLDRYISVWRTADQCPSKPHPAMVEECAYAMGVQAECTLVVGDSVHDMRMAQSANAKAIGVATGVNDPAALLAAGALEVAEDIRNVPNCIASVAVKEGG